MKKTKNNLIKKLGAGLVAMLTLCALWLPNGNVFAENGVDCVFDESGTRVCNIDLKNFGYGKFVLEVKGDGVGGPTDVDVRTFYYYPAYAELVKVDGKYYIDVHYNWGDGSEAPAGDVGSVVVKVYYPNSDEEVPFSPIEVELNASGSSRVELPFEEYGLNEGDYKIEVYAYDRDDQLLSLPYTFIAQYRLDEETPIPDTGAMFQNTNISKTDYLITGLVVFGLVAVAGVMFIMRSDKKKAALTRSNARSGKRSNTRSNARRRK